MAAVSCRVGDIGRGSPAAAGRAALGAAARQPCRPAGLKRRSHVRAAEWATACSASAAFRLLVVTFPPPFSFCWGIIKGGSAWLRVGCLLGSGGLPPPQLPLGYRGPRSLPPQLPLGYKGLLQKGFFPASPPPLSTLGTIPPPPSSLPEHPVVGAGSSSALGSGAGDCTACTSAIFLP